MSLNLEHQKQFLGAKIAEILYLYPHFEKFFKLTIDAYCLNTLRNVLLNENPNMELVEPMVTKFKRMCSVIQDAAILGDEALVAYYKKFVELKSILDSWELVEV